MANDQDFESMLSACQDASQAKYKDSEEFSNWMPPNGTYNWLAHGQKFNTFTSKKDQRKYGVLNLQASIISGPEESPDPALKDKVFTLSFFGNSNVDNGQLKKLTRLLNGDASPDYATSVRTLREAFGSNNVAGKVTIKRAPQLDENGTPTGEYFVNAYVDEITTLQPA